MNVFPNRILTYILPAFAPCFLGFSLIFLLPSCGGGSASQGAASDSTVINKATKNKVEAVSLNTTPDLPSFDNSYFGLFSDYGSVRVNLRRFGNHLSGTLWTIDGEKELKLEGDLEADGQTFKLLAEDKRNQFVGVLKGRLDGDKKMQGGFKAKDSEKEVPFIFNEKKAGIFNIKIDNLSVEDGSLDGSQRLYITIPQLLNIPDAITATRVNNKISDYFTSFTLKDSVNIVKYSFVEDVKFDITFLEREFVSICKHHHLSKDNNTELFDDSHGITINFKTGKVYEIRDLFKPNSMDQLNNLILSRINQSCSGTLTEAQLEACKLKPEEFNSFSLDKKNMTFHLTERLPYRLRGCGYVRINYEDLKPIFNPSGPLAKL